MTIYTLSLKTVSLSSEEKIINIKNIMHCFSPQAVPEQTLQYDRAQSLAGECYCHATIFFICQI